MEKIWDNIVIGSGMGGLSAAALLAKSGQSVIILEKGTSPGGCCSSFHRSGFLFESGATTLIGWEKGLPLVRLESELGIQFPKWELPVSMKVYLGGEVITRYRDPREWTEECVRVFGKPFRQKAFWKFTFYLSELVWNLSARYVHFPIHSFSDIVSLLKSFRWKDTIALFFSLVTTKQILYVFGLGRDPHFKMFLEEQLMITNQSSVDVAPFLSACAGLTYPNLINYYVPGGMVELPKKLIAYVLEKEGQYEPKSEVISIEEYVREGEGREWQVKTKQKSFRTRNVISNLPIWNLSEVFKERMGSLNRASQQFDSGIWGAFTMGIALPCPDMKEECLHHQIHIPGNLPHGGGASLFVSVSHEKDEIRSKGPVRILSVSTHLKDPEHWDRKAEDYQNKKLELTGAILEVLEKTFSWFRSENIVTLHSATPATWQTWTGRKYGRVGGIPSYFFRNPFRYLSPLSEIPNVYLTGDTVYPGQGIPAVCLGGMNLAKRMLARKRD